MFNANLGGRRLEPRTTRVFALIAALLMTASGCIVHRGGNMPLTSLGHKSSIQANYATLTSWDNGPAVDEPQFPSSDKPSKAIQGKDQPSQRYADARFLNNSHSAIGPDLSQVLPKRLDLDSEAAIIEEPLLAPSQPHAISDENLDQSFAPIPNADRQSSQPLTRAPSTLPSNTLIVQLDAIELDNQPTFRKLVAVPALYPRDIPPIVRIVKIENGQPSQSETRPYSLTIVASPSEGDVQPIAPILDELRKGRRSGTMASTPSTQR